MSTRRKSSVSHEDWCALVLPSRKGEFWVLVYFQNLCFTFYQQTRAENLPQNQWVLSEKERSIACYPYMVGYPACCIAKYSSLQILSFVWLRKEQNQCLHSSLITWLQCENMWGFKKLLTIIIVLLPFRSLNPHTIFCCNKQIRDWYFPSERFLKHLSLLCLIERVLKLNQYAMHSISVRKMSHVHLFEGLELHRSLYHVKENPLFSGDQQRLFSGPVMYRCLSFLWCSAFIDLNVFLGKRAISNLRGTASPLSFTAGCTRKPMFKPEISICLKSGYVTANERKERKM